MLDALKFVKGAVSTKDFVPALTHFRIADGHVIGFNGKLALCSPIDLDLMATPKAEPFVRAIESCESEISLSLTSNNRLAVRSGSFKAFIECTADVFPEPPRHGTFIEHGGGLLDALRVVLPYVATDASRPWAMGVLLRGQSAYATNNVILVEHWLGVPFPVEVNIPKYTVQELLRVGEEPVGLQVAENSITFYYADGRWMNSLLFSTTWPDVSRVLVNDCEPLPVRPSFFRELARVAPFTDKNRAVYLYPDRIATVRDGDDGASVAFADLPVTGTEVFNIDQLIAIEPVAQHMDFRRFPAPTLFYGHNLRGAIVGLRL